MKSILIVYSWQVKLQNTEWPKLFLLQYKIINSLPLENIQELLANRYRIYNIPAFIPTDPVCIPHLFTRKQDIEISGFFAAILAWGQRKTIINKCSELIRRFDNAPFDFVK